MERKFKFATQCVHAGEKPDPVFGAHTTPIFQTSTFIFDSVEQGASRFAEEEDGYVYTRIPPNTPTHAVLSEKFAALEGGGEAGQTFASGMAAITAVALTALKRETTWSQLMWSTDAPTAFFQKFFPGSG